MQYTRHFRLIFVTIVSIFVEYTSTNMYRYRDKNQIGYSGNGSELNPAYTSSEAMETRSDSVYPEEAFYATYRLQFRNMSLSQKSNAHVFKICKGDMNN